MSQQARNLVSASVLNQNFVLNVFRPEGPILPAQADRPGDMCVGDFDPEGVVRFAASNETPFQGDWTGSPNTQASRPGLTEPALQAGRH
jgi:hypothetical protein